MLNSVRASFVVILALALPRLGEAFMAADSVRGIVTDDLDQPLDGVYVTGSWGIARTKGDGSFQMALPTSTGIGPIAPMGGETGVLWNPERGAFTWPGVDGDVSIRVQDIRGRLAARLSSRKGAAAGEFSLADLPQGNHIAAITVRNRTDAYRIVRLPGGASTLLGAVSRSSGPAFLAKSAALPNTLTFTKAGYKPGTAAATGSAAVKVKLASDGDPKAAYALAKVELESEVDSLIAGKWKDAFVHVAYPAQVLDRVQTVSPGGSIQAAVNAVSAAGGGVVVLKAGTHALTATLNLKSRVTLTGEGRARTLLKQGPGFTDDAITAGASPRVTDVVIKDLTLEGARAGGGTGIFLAGSDGGRHTRILLQNVTVANWAGQGVHMKRVDNIIMDNCIFQYNGAANGLYHNVYFLYTQHILQSDCDMSYPVLGKGNKYTSSKYVIAQRCAIRNSTGNGIQADHTNAAYILFHKYAVTGCARVALWFPCENYVDKYTYTENPIYAPQHVILNRCHIAGNTWGAMWRVVGNSYVLNSTFANKNIDMGLLKCGVAMENNTFAKGNQIYTDVKQWPADVKILW